MLQGSFISHINTLVVPGGKMGLAMELIMAPLVQRLLEGKKIECVERGAGPRPFRLRRLADPKLWVTVAALLSISATEQYSPPTGSPHARRSCRSGPAGNDEVQVDMGEQPRASSRRSEVNFTSQSRTSLRPFAGWTPRRSRCSRPPTSAPSPSGWALYHRRCRPSAPVAGSRFTQKR